MFTYDLVDLRLFSAAARAGSVSQAASEVHLAGSSASARLKAFEARSGVKLFERSPHGVDLTPAGVSKESSGGVRGSASQRDDGWLGGRRQCLSGAASRGEHQTH